MTDVDEILRAELTRLVPAGMRPSWEEVVDRSGIRAARRRRWLVALAAVTAAIVVGVATPLGSAIANGVGDFSAWVTGQPGSPVSDEEQRKFEAKNVRSWIGFPEGTELRRLITQRHGESTIELLGFRGGSSTLCLRVVASGQTRGATTSCAPLAELRRAGAPARVVIVDHGFGIGHDVAWFGINRLRSSALRITAGISADDVQSVVVEVARGRHEILAASNAFLYVAVEPKVEQRVTRISARTRDALVPVPFAPAPFAFGGRPTPARPAPAAPDVVRSVSNGRIGWLERRETRGEALDVLPAGARRTILGQEVPGLGSARGRNVLFGRVLAPDPDRPRRLVVTLNAHRPGGPAAGMCTWLVTRGGLAGGGCTSYPEVFQRKPIVTGMSYYGPSEFVVVEGFATDDVDRVEARLADGQKLSVPLKDNALLIDLARASLPARLVAYDENGRVIGSTRAFTDFADRAAPARGRAVELWRVRGPNGAHAELFVGPSTIGGECMFVKHYSGPRSSGMMTLCATPRWREGPLELSVGTPFVSGRVRDDVELVRLNFADGSSRTVRPRRGYLLVSSASDFVSAAALDRNGTLIGRFAVPKPAR